jgi:hypothetical protein
MCTDHWWDDANGKSEVVVFYECEILSGTLQMTGNKYCDENISAVHQIMYIFLVHPT